MIYNEGTLQQAQRAMRRRHRPLQSQDPVAYAASEPRVANGWRHCFSRRGNQPFLPQHEQHPPRRSVGS
jgi:hypothetical protein